MEPVPVLVGVGGTLSGQRFAVTATGIRLGREPGNEVWIDDAGVSRQHARVILHNGAVWVQDAGSRNGVFVNAERVADHRTLKPGDQVTVGGHSFVFELQDPGASVPPAKAPANPRSRLDARTVVVGDEAPARRWKVWPFALAGVMTAGCIGCFGAYGWLRGDAVATTPSGGPAYSLSTVLPADGAPVPAPVATPTLADVLAPTAVPVAPAGGLSAPGGTTATELVERAHAQYETGRLNEARQGYQLALTLDPACEICRVRVERLNAEIAEKAQMQLDAGMRYWDSMQVQQAVASWETVLLLVPEATDPLHQRAAEALTKARGK